jgi:hypothetical protein
MQIIGYKSHESQDSVTVDYQVRLPVYQFFIWSSVGFHTTTIDLLSVDLFDLLSITSTSIFPIHFDLRISLPVDPPRLDFHYKEYNNPTFSHLLSSLLKLEIFLNFCSQTQGNNAHCLSAPRELHNTHRLGQRVCYVFQHVYFLQQHLVVFHHVSHEMVLYINMLSLGMISWVLFQKYCSLTVTTYLHSSLLKPDS